jgi:hypothetical protein
MTAETGPYAAAAAHAAGVCMCVCACAFACVYVCMCVCVCVRCNFGRDKALASCTRSRRVGTSVYACVRNYAAIVNERPKTLESW